MLLIPATLQIVHAFEDHHSSAVFMKGDQVQFNLHETDCLLCDLLMDSVALSPNLSHPEIHKQVVVDCINHYNNQYYGNPIYLQTLRGPPLL